MEENNTEKTTEEKNEPEVIYIGKDSVLTIGTIPIKDIKVKFFERNNEN